MTILKERSILEITGDDRKKFLQGLITNDINKASEATLIYSAMLNSQGRFLYDLFICEIGETLILDCLATRRDEILKKLNFYKLRSKVDIKKNDDSFVISNSSGDGFIDPRNNDLGFRSYVKDYSASNDNSYHQKRISLKIPESEHDLTYEKSFILEFDFDNLNAIDYQKGCYVGQELTARTHYRGEIRKKIFHIELPEIISPADSNSLTFLKDSKITCEGKTSGIILSTVFFESKLHGLALIRLPQESDFDSFKEKLKFKDQKIFIIS